MGPFKCPECGVWWVGLEHRCVKAAVRSWTNDVPPPPPSITIQYVPPLQVTTTSPSPPFIRPVNS